MFRCFFYIFPVNITYFLLSPAGKAILKIPTEQTKVPTMNIMQITPSTMIMEVRAQVKSIG